VERIAAADRREALLEAAVRVIARDGMARASTRAIAAEAGMPTASFHYVFASYDAMVELLVARGLAAQREEVAAAVDDSPDLRAYATGALLGWLHRVAAQPEQELALHEIVGWSRSARDERRLAAVVYAHYTAVMDSFVAAAEQRFGVRWRVPSADVARLALVVTDGVAARWTVDRDDEGARTALLLGAEALVALAEETDR
jgi:TetR/AcrR family transcriptional regulator, regulator of biofilm formation and stress response